MNNCLVTLMVLLCYSALLTGCGNSPSTPAPTAEAEVATVAVLGNWQEGDTEKGRALFEQRVMAGGAGCITCHALDPDVTLVGPSLYGVATKASTRIEGTAAADYLFQSIVDPNRSIVDGFTANVMPTNYGYALHEDDVTNLISFLMTLQRDN